MENWRGITGTIEQFARPDDVVVVAATRPDAFHYYYDGSAPVGCPFDALPSTVLKQPDVIRQFEQQVQRIVSNRHGRVWLAVRIGRQTGDSRPLVTEALRQQYPHATIIYERQFDDRLFVYGYDLSPRRTQLQPL